MEGADREFSVMTKSFSGENGQVKKLHCVRVDAAMKEIPGSEFELKAELVLLAMGFVGPERAGLLTDLGVEITGRGNVARDDSFQTSVPGVFVAGDMGRGQSLIVWAIAEGRSCAAAVDRHLMGDTQLPAPIAPTAAPMR